MQKWITASARHGDQMAPRGQPGKEAASPPPGLPWGCVTLTHMKNVRDTELSRASRSRPTPV